MLQMSDSIEKVEGVNESRYYTCYFDLLRVFPRQS